MVRAPPSKKKKEIVWKTIQVVLISVNDAIKENVNQTGFSVFVEDGCKGIRLEKKIFMSKSFALQQWEYDAQIPLHLKARQWNTLVQHFS